MVDQKKVKLFQIFYDSETASQIQSGFEPLNNTDGPADFFEIYPIFKYLKSNEISEDKWFGFFSPKLQEKTQITSEDVCQEIQEIDEQYDVCSFSAHWSDIAFFQNVWEHGEYCHPGLANISQSLANEAGYNFRLLDSFSCLDNAVYSHYLVAKGKFWKQWYHIVKTYLEMITKDDALFEYKTLHGGKPVSMHAFVVERVPSLILQDQSFKVKVSNKVTSNRGTFLDGVFNSASVYGEYAIKAFPEQLKTADTVKRLYRDTGDKKFLDDYWHWRFSVPQLSGYHNLTECAVRYVNENCHSANINGFVKKPMVA